MTVKELIERLSKLQEETVVLSELEPHVYREPFTTFSEVVKDGKYYYDPEFGKVETMKAVIFS